MKPTMPPMTMIMIGSRIEVSALTAALDLVLVEVGDLVEHRVERAGLLADADHVGDHRREDRRLAAASAIVPPRLTESMHAVHRLLDDLVAAGPAGDVDAPGASARRRVTSDESVRDQRASATFWTMSPIFIGIRSRKRSHCGRPHVDRFHLQEREMTAATMTTISRYQWPVTKCERPTVNCVIAGSLPPNSLKTLLEHRHEEGDERDQHADREGDDDAG